MTSLVLTNKKHRNNLQTDRQMDNIQIDGMWSAEKNTMECGQKLPWSAQKSRAKILRHQAIPSSGNIPEYLNKKSGQRI